MPVAVIMPQAECVDCGVQTDVRPHIWPSDYADFKVRVDVDDDTDDRNTKLVPLAVLIRIAKAKCEPLPILTVMERIRKEQQLKGAYKSRAEASAESARVTRSALGEELMELRDARSALDEALMEFREARLKLEVERQRHFKQLAAQGITYQQQVDELQQCAAQHQLAAYDAGVTRDWRAGWEQGQQEAQQQAAAQVAAERQRAEALAKWKRIEVRMAEQRGTAAQQQLSDAHANELAARSKRTKTWQGRRSNIMRAVLRLAQASTDARKLARETAAAARVEVAAAEANCAALHAELGETFKVADQRACKGPRAPFVPRVILRDVRTRMLTLNAGAKNTRLVTQNYSQSIDVDGRDLKLESGCRASVHRWEKRVDVLCLMIEGRELRNTCPCDIGACCGAPWH